MFELALTFFLVANPIGNSPAMISLVKDFDFRKQKIILFREAIFALIIALFFQYFGEVFLGRLHIELYAVTIAGGILLTFVALGMIFTSEPPEKINANEVKQEPFIVPIATPIISGPGLLAIIMVNASRLGDNFKISMAILIAWIGVILVLTTAPYLQKILKKRGLIALEQVMGMILAMISFEMIVSGSSMFIKALHN